MTDFAAQFSTFTDRAWRLEARDTYDVPEERAEVEEFLRIGYVGPDPEWHEVVRAAHARGARMGRVRLVGRPLTDYTRYELVAYAHSVASGEDVRIVDRSWLDDSWRHAPDFWVFDGAVWLMRYADTGAFLGAEPVADPAPYLRIRSIAEAVSVPWSAYSLSDVPAPRVEALPVLPAECVTTG